MAKKNNGKESEKIFENFMKSKGKDVFIYRMVDTNEIKHAHKFGFVKSSPADYIVTDKGKMFYAEVKSSSDGRASYSFGHFTKAQKAAMVQQTAAGGQYFVYLHEMISNQWYLITGKTILNIQKEGRKSIKWSELTGCKISIGETND